MARLSLLVIAVAAMAASAAVWPHAGSAHDQLMVTYSISPDPFHKKSFFKLPRTLDEVENGKEYWFKIEERHGLDVYCKEQDYRVCLLFDLKGSVAGIRISVTRDDMDASGVDLKNKPEWEDNWDSAFIGPVYTATAFFLSKEELSLGGRHLKKGEPTAPNGIYILQTDHNGFETNRVHIPTQQSQAGSAGFTEQACFFGMGKHYFQELRNDSKCEDHRPYFTLYGPKTKELNGFGIAQYGKVSSDKDGREWFEHPSSEVVKKIAPNSPACLEYWALTKGIFSLHVYFVDHAYWTFC